MEIANAILHKDLSRSDGVRFDLQEPQERSSEYEELIDMIAMHPGTELVLIRSQYNEIINDKTAWALAAKSINSTYAFSNTLR